MSFKSNRDPIELGFSIDRVNDILRKEFGFGLYIFLKILVLQLEYDDFADFGVARRPFMHKQDMLEVKQKIRTARKKAHESLDGYYRVVIPGSFKRGYAGSEDKEKLRLFDMMESHVDYLISLRKSGRPKNETVHLLCSWAEFMFLKSAIKRSPWNMLTCLFKWTWEKLESYPRYQPLKPKSDDLYPLYFQNQYSKKKAALKKLFGYESYRLKLYVDEPDVIFLGKAKYYYRYGTHWMPKIENPDRQIFREKNYQKADIEKDGRLIIFPDLSFVREQE